MQIYITIFPLICCKNAFLSVFPISENHRMIQSEPVNVMIHLCGLCHALFEFIITRVKLHALSRDNTQPAVLL